MLPHDTNKNMINYRICSKDSTFVKGKWVGRNGDGCPLLARGQLLAKRVRAQVVQSQMLERNGQDFKSPLLQNVAA